MNVTKQPALRFPSTFVKAVALATLFAMLCGGAPRALASTSEHLSERSAGRVVNAAPEEDGSASEDGQHDNEGGEHQEGHGDKGNTNNASEKQQGHADSGSSADHESKGEE